MKLPKEFETHINGTNGELLAAHIMLLPLRVAFIVVFSVLLVFGYMLDGTKWLHDKAGDVVDDWSVDIPLWFMFATVRISNAIHAVRTHKVEA